MCSINTNLLLFLVALFISIGLFAQDPYDPNQTSLYISPGDGPGLYLQGSGSDSAILTVQGSLTIDGSSLIQDDSTLLILKSTADQFKGSLFLISDSGSLDSDGYSEVQGDLWNYGQLSHNGTLKFGGPDTQTVAGYFTDSNSLNSIFISKTQTGELIFVDSAVDVLSNIEFGGQGCIILRGSELYLKNPDTNAISGFLSLGSYGSLSQTILTLGNQGGFRREVRSGYSYDFPVSNDAAYNPIRVEIIGGPDTSDVIIRLEDFAGATINYFNTFDSLPCSASPISLQYDCLLQNGVWRIDGRDDSLTQYRVFTFPDSSSFADCYPSGDFNFRTVRSLTPSGDWSLFVEDVMDSTDLCMYYTANQPENLMGVPIPGGSYTSYSSIGVAAGPAGSFTLPVEWLYFTAKPLGQSALLEWGTGVEIDNTGFAVYRGTSTNLLEMVDFVDSKSNLNDFNQYEYIDRNVEPGQTYYYQLKQIDLNGNYEWSKIRSVFIEEDDFEFQAYPNPTNSFVRILVGEKDPASLIVNLFDPTGMKLNVPVEVQNQQLILDLREISPGQYLLNLLSQYGEDLGSKTIIKAE